MKKNMAVSRNITKAVIYIVCIFLFGIEYFSFLGNVHEFLPVAHMKSNRILSLYYLRLISLII